MSSNADEAAIEKVIETLINRVTDKLKQVFDTIEEVVSLFAVPYFSKRTRSD
jgi:hypothetical protein